MSAVSADLGELARLQRRLERERRSRTEAEQIAERTTRELYARQRELDLLVTVARAANESDDARHALSIAVTRICEHTGWPVGHVFLADPDVGLRPSGIWHLDDPGAFATFREVTEATTLAPGESLGGRVLAGAAPLWCADVDDCEDFAQAGERRELGVRSAFGFPLLVGAEVVGVMEFFNDEPEPPHERLLELMAQIGTELGRTIERDRARAAQRELTDALTARAAELERSNSELEQFASIASHDLQEPLRKVRTFTNGVMESEGARLSEQGHDRLQRANNAAARMQTLVEDLLAFSRVATRGRPFVATDLDRVTSEVLEDLEVAVVRAHADVRVAALATIEADPLQMRQLLANLLANALKFRRDDGPVVITVDCAVDADAAAITVSDNGIGFDPRYSERIFRIFERLHGRAEYDGTGIGLALCRKIAERHGGTVHAESAPGGGARFTVTLPLRQPAVPELAAAP